MLPSRLILIIQRLSFITLSNFPYILPTHIAFKQTIPTCKRFGASTDHGRIAKGFDSDSDNSSIKKLFFGKSMHSVIREKSFQIRVPETMSWQNWTPMRVLAHQITETRKDVTRNTESGRKMSAVTQPAVLARVDHAGMRIKLDPQRSNPQNWASRTTHSAHRQSAVISPASTTFCHTDHLRHNKGPPDVQNNSLKQRDTIMNQRKEDVRLLKIALRTRSCAKPALIRFDILLDNPQISFTKTIIRILLQFMSNPCSTPVLERNRVKTAHWPPVCNKSMPPSSCPTIKANHILASEPRRSLSQCNWTKLTCHNASPQLPT